MILYKSTGCTVTTEKLFQLAAMFVQDVQISYLRSFSNICIFSKNYSLFLINRFQT